MSWLDQVIGYGTHAARPAAGSAGRLYYETDTDTLLRDDGSTWDALTLGSGGGGGSIAAAVRAYNSANQTIPTNAFTVLTFNTTTFDVGTSSPQHSTSTNPSRLTAQESGVYQISGLVAFDSPGAGTFGHGLEVRLNGSTTVHQTYDDDSSGYHYRNISFAWQLSATDYVELLAFQSTGGDLAILSSSAYTPAFMMARVA